jgi:hypothetical protein
MELRLDQAKGAAQAAATLALGQDNQPKSSCICSLRHMRNYNPV